MVLGREMRMGRKRHTPEQIIRKLREAEVELAKGLSTGDVVRRLGITEQTDYRWRKECNTFRRHSALGYRPPAPEAVQWPILNTIGLLSAATVGLTSDAD